MRRVSEYLRDYHPIVQTLLAGTVFTMLTNSMSLVFLPIYLLQNSSLTSPEVGLIVGAGALAATIGGFIGGVLSDRLGRHKLMILSLWLLAFAFLGLLLTRNPLALLCLSILRGIASSFFATISKALMGDLTPPEKRFRVFSNRYLAANIGFSIGPIVGAYLGVAGSSAAFAVSSIFYLSYSFALLYIRRRYAMPSTGEASHTSEFSIVSAIGVLSTDRVLLLFVIGGVLLTTVHGEMSVTLSQYLSNKLTDGIKLFGLLMSINGVMVILIQVMVTKWSERFTLLRRLMMGAALLALGEIGFAVASDWTGFILSMAVFTLGEILVLPAEYTLVDRITPPGKRGTYYGAQSMGEFGNFIGPWLGGVLLAGFGGKALFLTMAGIALTSLLFYRKGSQLSERQYMPNIRQITM